MRIVCPDCAAAYDVPATRLAGRTQLRCAACGHRWAPERPVIALPDPELEPSPPDEPALAQTAVQARPALASPQARLAPPAPPARAQRALLAAWAGSLALVGVAIAVLAVEYRSIAAAWPPMERLYDAVGLGSR